MSNLLLFGNRSLNFFTHGGQDSNVTIFWLNQLSTLTGLNCWTLLRNKGNMLGTKIIKVKSDHRSKFSNLSNWKEEA